MLEWALMLSIFIMFGKAVSRKPIYTGSLIPLGSERAHRAEGKRKSEATLALEHGCHATLKSGEGCR